MNRLGLAGEESAAQFLKAKGYRLLERNFAAPYGEIDMIAQDKKTLVFVEVKSRAYTAFGGPLMAVTPAKQKKIARTAHAYLQAKGLKFDSIRFDVICVLPEKIEHIENAFIPERTTM